MNKTFFSKQRQASGLENSCSKRDQFNWSAHEIKSIHIKKKNYKWIFNFDTYYIKKTIKKSQFSCPDNYFAFFVSHITNEFTTNMAENDENFT